MLINTTSAEGVKVKISDSKKSSCKYSLKGDSLSSGCYFAATSIFALPKDALTVGQKSIEQISVPYAINELDLSLNIEREFTLEDYVKVGDKTLARLSVKERLVSASLPEIKRECPKIYYASSRVIYLDTFTNLPYDIMSLTKVGFKGEIDLAIVVKLSE